MATRSFKVETTEDFHKATKEARPYDYIVYDGPEWESNIQFDAPLVISRKLRFCGVEFSCVSQSHIITTESIEFSNCKFIGKFGETRKLLRSEISNYLIFQDCSFGSASIMCLDLFSCKECHIIDSHFSGDSPTEYGYGIWQGGSGSAKGQQLTVIRSNFLFLRHGIDGHYNANHKTIIGCTFDSGVKASISQHSGENEQGKDVPGIGGGNTKIIGCRFLDSDSFGISSMPPQPGHTLQIIDNTFIRPYGKAMEFELPDRIKYRENQIQHPQIILEGNTYEQ